MKLRLKVFFFELSRHKPSKLISRGPPYMKYAPLKLVCLTAVHAAQNFMPAPTFYTWSRVFIQHFGRLVELRSKVLRNVILLLHKLFSKKNLNTNVCKTRSLSQFVVQFEQTYLGPLQSGKSVVGFPAKNRKVSQTRGKKAS